MKDYISIDRILVAIGESADPAVLEAARALANRSRLLERKPEPVRVLASVRPKWPPFER